MLWKGIEEHQLVEVSVKDENICVWRLFDEPEMEYERIKYWINFKGAGNAEVMLFDYDPIENVSITMSNLDKPAMNLAEVQAEYGDKPFKVNWWTFKHSNVFIMARKVNPDLDSFTVNFSYKYKIVPGIGSGAVGTLIFFGVLFSIVGLIFLLYSLHIRGIIEVRIPKPFRIWCFKNYLSPEEKAEIAKAEAALRKIEMQRELNRRMGMKPNEKGFEIDDSFFDEYEGGPKRSKKIKSKPKNIEESGEFERS